MKQNTHITAARQQVARTKGAAFGGGTLLRGVQTHTDRRNLPARLDRKRWNAGRNGFPTD
jgi:hypothetical protein